MLLIFLDYGSFNLTQQVKCSPICFNGLNQEVQRKPTTHEWISVFIVRGKQCLLQVATRHNKVPTTG